MVLINEGRLTFSFPQNADVTKYDEWAFYRKQFNKAFGGTKAVDLIYIDKDQTWLIEAKDYRAHRRTKFVDLGDEIALKIRDTLAGLLAGSCNASDPEERRLARLALKRKKLRVVLHLEQPRRPSKLFPQVADPSKLIIKLKQKVGAVDAHPMVVDQHHLKPSMNWKVKG